MEYGVYLESSCVVSLKPRVLDFLNKLAEKAKDVKDFALTFTKKEIAQEFGKDLRTVNRYLDELEDKNLIELKGKRGRYGGTVLVFNTEVVRFETSDKAFVNNDVEIDLDDIVDRKFPKKKKKEPTRHRRTKKEMVIAKALADQKQSEVDKLNEELSLLGGVPNWEWFKKTSDPVGNYKTYLISRMYNRYAVLFVERSNYFSDFQLPLTRPDFDCLLDQEFFGKSRWQNFERFRQWCEENGIDPAVYLSAQFGRSVFTAASRGQKKNIFPFYNSLKSEASLEVYRQYCQVRSNTLSALSAKRIPAEFVDDFVIKSLKEAYNTADQSQGLEQFRGSIDDLLNGATTADEQDLVKFYNITMDTLDNSEVSDKTKDVIDRFLTLQLMIECGGASRLPFNVILSTEIVQAALVKVKRDYPNNSEVLAKVLGNIVHPKAEAEVQEMEGRKYMFGYNKLYDTPRVLRLIMERKGLALSIAEIREALKEYGNHLIPVNDFSFLDVKQILTKVRNMEDHVEFVEGPSHEDMAAITRKNDVDFYQYKQYDEMAQFDNFLADALAEELNK